MVGFVIYCVLSNFLFTACIQSNKNPIANNDRSENYKSTFLFCCATHNNRVTFICTILSTEWLPMPTDYEHPESFFFENPKRLGLGRQIGPKILGAFGVFSANLTAPILVLWVPCFSLIKNYFYKKTSLYIQILYIYVFGIGIWIWIWVAKN